MTIFAPADQGAGNLIGDKLAKLALKIADEASTEGVGLADRIDAFKVLTTYYVNTTKINAGVDPEPDDGVPTFDNLQQRIASASNRS
jgi:hypothetical protein